MIPWVLDRIDPHDRLDVDENRKENSLAVNSLPYDPQFLSFEYIAIRCHSPIR